eukprot:14897262-Alexandrium_andersonii.AAC.1
MSRGPKSSLLEDVRALGDDSEVQAIRKAIKRCKDRLAYLKRQFDTSDEQVELEQHANRLRGLLSSRASREHARATDRIRYHLESALQEIPRQEAAVGDLQSVVAGAVSAVAPGAEPDE